MVEETLLHNMCLGWPQDVHARVLLTGIAQSSMTRVDILWHSESSRQYRRTQLKRKVHIKGALSPRAYDRLDTTSMRPDLENLVNHSSHGSHYFWCLLMQNSGQDKKFPHRNLLLVDSGSRIPRYIWLGTRTRKHDTGIGTSERG